MIRCQRQVKIKADPFSNYTDIEQIRREVLFAMRQFENRQWPLLDVTYKSIEETATEVMRLIYARSGLKKGNVF